MAIFQGGYNSNTPKSTMSNSAIAHVINAIHDNQPSRISITTKAGGTLHLDCTCRGGEAPTLFLAFSPHDLPGQIDMAASCLVSISSTDENTAPVMINARIEKIIGENMLELTAQNLMDPAKLRQYFRVALTAPVTISFEKNTEEAPCRQCSLEGETLDLSGSGLLGIFSQECKERQAITIDLDLPSPQASISCTGHVVHARRVRRGRYQIALHFDDITNGQRDIILSNCLSEQRRQLNRGLHPGY